ncbi:MAG TPA: PPOX class F420-dependent oxidoreductase [Nitrososphaerales archaeon]|nr:PPOX class F420-dependent oxidoreductase [Nitrososphaerales archaeon]
MTKLAENVVEFIARPLFGKIATVSRDGTPHVTPIWYMYVDGKLLVNTAHGRVKYGNMKRTGRAALLVDDGYGYVLFSGRARRATERDPLKDIETLAVRYNGEEQGKKQTREVFARQKRVTFEIIPDKVIVSL